MISEVDPAFTVLNIGQYNKYVTSCPACPDEVVIEPLGRDCLGFGSPASCDRVLAVVYECPDCYLRLWSHTDMGGYRSYQRYLLRRQNEEKATKGEHWAWPQNASWMNCPLDGENYRWGCQCVRDNPALVPGAIRSWYIENWKCLEVSDDV